LSQINYGNGYVVKSVYNDLEILTEIWYNDNTKPAYKYKYTSDCKLAMIIDNIYGTITAYKYDNEGKVIETVVYDSETY